MRCIFAGLLIVMIMPLSVAIAEDGTHATLTMTTKIDMGDMLPPEMAGDNANEPMVMGGDLWLTENKMRMELDLSTVSAMGPTGPSITIMDLEENVMYLLDPDTKTAMRHNLTQYQEMAGGFGDDIMNPASMFQGFDGYLDSLDGMPGVEYTVLDAKTISGFMCKGLSYTVDMEKMMEDMDTSEIPGGEMMGTMGDMSGVIWFSEDVGMMPVAMKTQMDMMGMAMAMDWLLTDIEAWSATDSTFAIPEGYTVEDFDMESQFEAPNMPGEAA